jgi:transcriptional regulator with XRE-family HTH domain
MTLKELRRAKGYTQKFVAKKLNVNQAAISHWENGKNAPTKKYHQKIAKLYECTVDDLLKDK